MADRWRLWVPLLPATALSPNGPHGHWSKINAARDEMRAAVAACVLARRDRPQWERVRVAITLRCTTHKRPRDGRYRPTDLWNLAAAMKPAVDGLVDAGVVPDDDHGHMRMGHHKIQRVEDLTREGLSITVTRLA